jgi:hypothetical protein
LRDYANNFDWSLLTAAETATRHDIIDAGHHTMLEEPYVSRLASAIMKKASKTTGEK